MAHDPILPNLAGDRDIEWGFVFAHLETALAYLGAPGRFVDILDFGPGKSFIGYVAALRGHRVTALDLDPAPRHYRHPNLRLLAGDILTLDDAALRPGTGAGAFDLVVNCSTIEHVGLAGRYTTARDTPDGDLLAMARLRCVMRPGGVMLLTIPVGQDAVFAPMCRVYGRDRLPRLLEGFTIVHEVFWCKPARPDGGCDNIWSPTTRAAACAIETRAGDADPLRNYYALGGFMLCKA
jgi:hypothetical protein